MRAFVVRHRLLLSTALLWWLSGAFQIFPLGWVALVPFFFSLEGLTTRQRFRVGYATGFVSFGLINWWLIPTITKGAPAIGAPVFAGFFLSFVAVAIIAAGHALQPALVALLWDSNFRYRPLLVALAWVFGDYIRTLTPLAHEWGALAFSQTGDLPLLQVAAVLTQHGVTFFCAFFAAGIAMWLSSRQRSWFVIPVLAMAAVHVWGFIQLRQLPEGRELRVLVVQTAVSSLSKTGLATGETAFPQAFRLTSEALKKSGNSLPGLVVWPETTAGLRRSGTLYTGLDWETWRREGPRVPVVMGAQTFDERNRAWNEAVLVMPEGATQSRAKSRLVPFGERAPLVGLLPFLQVLAPSPMLEPGEGTKTFDLPGKTTLDTQICFESCFPQQVNGKLLVIMTNDEWFAGTEAPRQHQAMGVLRAVENRVPVVQSANGGYSFVVTPQGRVTMASAFGLPQTLDATVLVPN